MGADPERVGNYLVFPPFAKGGMATVHLARLGASAGFRRVVVVKRMLPGLVGDQAAATRLLREARLSSRVRSPYVVPTVDVVQDGESLLLAMELVEGVTLGRLLALSKSERPMPPAVAVAIARDVLRGLHSAHEAVAEDGTPLEIVHRDVTPQNVMIGADGRARLVDFGIAHTLGQRALTATGEIRGTLGYVAPEQLRGGKAITRAADLYAVGVILWEALTGERLRAGADVSSVLRDIEAARLEPPSARVAGLPAALDAVVVHALAPVPSDRPATAEAMGHALESALTPASDEDVRRYVDDVAADEIEQLRERVRACEMYEEAAPHTPRPSSAPPLSQGRALGRYVLYEPIASGGMASVHFGRLAGPVGFSRTVAIKRLHPHLASDGRFKSMLIDEARMLVRVRHPNVVSVLDIVEDGDELLLVMDYVQGETVAALLDVEPHKSAHLPPRIACAIIVQALHGLHAAHESHDEAGRELGIVHRDFSPHNLMVGFDGTARVLDFGIAKAAGRIQQTRDGELKGKVAYMAPELLTGGVIDRRADVWGAALVLAEMLTGERLFEAEAPGATMNRIVAGKFARPSTHVASLPAWIDAIVERGLAVDPVERFPTAHAMARAVEEHGDVATPRELGEWMRANATERSQRLATRLAEIESGAVPSDPAPTIPPSSSSRSPAALAAPIAEQERTSSKRTAGLVVALLAMMAFGAFISTRFFPRDAKPDRAAPEERRPDTVTIASAPVASAPVAATAPVASEAQSNAPGASVAPIVDAGRAPVRTTKPVTPTRPPPSTATHVPPARTRSCDPPYTVDENGFRVPKPECI